MSEENQTPVEAATEDNHGDSFVDAVSAIALVAIAVVIALYWVSNQ